MIIAGLILLALLQVADLVTTALFLRRGVSEANPIVRRLFALGGWPAVVVGKLAITAAFVAYVLAFPGLAGLAVLVLALLLMVWTVGGNLMLLGD